jgi:Rieske Fe-S protein
MRRVLGQLRKNLDCPRHGSRFGAFGHVLNDPAISDLRPLDVAKQA